MTEILQWVSNNSDVICVSALFATLACLVIGAAAYDRRASIRAYWEHRRTIRIQRGLLMGKKKAVERRAYLKGRWCDGITDFGEKEFLEGRQTREEVNAFYRAIGKTHYMPDLVPVLTNAQLKAAIKGRKARGGGVTAGPAQERPAWGEDNILTPSPTTPTASDVSANVIQAAKKFGAKALSKVQKVA